MQTKLSINQPNDADEQEADTVAEKSGNRNNINKPSAFFSPAVKPLLRAELNQENKNAQTQALTSDVADAETLTAKNSPCSYTVKYGNPRLLTVPSCGGAIQFDILQVQSPEINCRKQLKGKQLSEVVTTDNNCFKTGVITGPPVTLGDNGIPVTVATDTYGLNMPRQGLIDCSIGIPCPQEMKQELSVDGKLVTTNIIRFDICGSGHGCVTKIYMNGVFLGTVATGDYQRFYSAP